MLQNRPRAFRAALVAAGFCSAACAGDEGPEASLATALRGTWLLRGTTTHDGCDGQAPSFPFAPQQVRLETSVAELSITDPELGTVSYARVAGESDGSVFARQEKLQHRGCEIRVASRWQVIAVSDTRLVATLDVDAAAEGACEQWTGEAATTCRVRHVVSGMKP